MACGDVLSLEDLQTAKKHQIFEAEVITGKVGGVAGGATIDTAMNGATGQVQKTLPATINEIGIVRIGDFTAGCTVTARNQGVLEVGGSVYVWRGELPKVVPQGSTPASTGGIGPAAWLDVGDASVRSDLGNFISYDTTVGLATGKYPAGRRVSLSDRAGAIFIVSSGGTANGFDIINAGSGKTASLIDKTNISPEFFGSTAGDASPVFNAMFTAMDNNAVITMKANAAYAFSAGVTSSGKNMKIVANGASMTFSAGYFLTEGSAQDTLTTISADAARGLSTITASSTTHGLVPGDTVIIWNPVDFSFSGHRDYYRDGEFNEVLTVSGATIGLTNPLRSDYPASAGVKLIKMLPIKVDADDLTVIGNTTAADAWRIRLAKNATLRNCSGYSGRDNSLRLDRCYKFDAYGGTFECKTPADFLQYGVFVGNSQMVNFHKPRLHGTRHALATGGQNDLGSVPNRDVFIREANASSDLYWSLDMHGNIQNGQFIDCVTNRGVGLAGIDAAVIGGTHSRTDESPIQFGEVVGGTYRIKDLSLNVNTLAAVRANNSDRLYDVTKNIHFEIERIRVNGSASFETLALISYGWKSGTNWTVTVRDVTFTGVLPQAVVRLNKLTRPDAGNVPQPLSVVVSDVANVPTTSKWCELLGVAWVQGVTMFSLPAQSIKVPVTLNSGQFIGSDVGFSFTKYPTPPNVAVRYAGNAFAGNNMVFATASSITTGSGLTKLSTAAVTLTAGATVTNNSEITVSMDNFLF